MMKLTTMWRWMLAVVMLLGGTTAEARADAAPAGIVPNGNFEQLEGDWFEGWGRASAGHMHPVEEDGNHFVRVTLAQPGTAISTQRIALQEQWRFLDVSVRLRGQDITLGQQHWQTARLEYTFQDKDGKHIAGWPWLGLRENGSTEGWTRLKNTRIRIPDGAAYLHLAIGMWEAAGTVDIDDVTVIPIESAAARAQKIDPQQADALTNGSFNEVDPQTKLPAGWEPQGDTAAIHLTPAEEGAGTLRITREQPGDSYLAQRFVIHPWWARMDIGLEVRTGDDFQSDKTFRSGANLRYRFFDDSGRLIEEDHVGVAEGKHDWTPHAHTQRNVPAGAVEMEVLVGVFGGQGTAELRLPHVRPTVVERKPGDTPRELLDEWATTKPETVTDHRARLPLDGQWLFQPARAATAKEPAPDAWGTIRVPGNWHNAIVSQGQGDPWQDFAPKETAKAWYKRSVTLPGEWAGRAIILQFDRIGTDAKVWVNGSEAGTVRWPAGQIDITSHLKPGERNEILLLVLAAEDPAQAEKLLQQADAEVALGQLASRGLIGSVDLLARPAGAHVAGLLLRPSVRQRKLDLDVELAQVARHGQVQLRAEMLNGQGEVEQTFEQSLPVAVARQQKLTASWPWEQPRLYDLGQPNRYTMRLHISGPGFEDSLVQSFGFREFWIDGKKFFLNGREIRLRPHALMPGDGAKQLLDRGYNYGEIRSPARSFRDGPGDVVRTISEAEQAGLLIGVPLISQLEQVNPAAWDTPEGKEAARRIMESNLRRWCNSPAVVMWTLDGAGTGTPADANPWRIGRADNPAMPAEGGRHRVVGDVMEMIRGLDPTRPIYLHAGSAGGDVYAARVHLGFLPLQEREEWLSAWVQDGAMPFMAVEMTIPPYMSLLHGREIIEPWLSEWCAVYLGSEAYRLEPPEYRKAIAERHGADAQPAWQPGDSLLRESPAYHKVLELFAVNTWRSWRTMGVTGGMAPFGSDDSNDVPALRRVNGSSLAWIAGAGGPPLPGEAGAQQEEAFTGKGHAFAVGQKVVKQVALLNDHRDAVQAAYEWKAFLGDQEVASGRSESPLDLAPAETCLLPIEFSLPGELQGEKAAGRIELTATIGPDEHKDTFPFEVFPPVPPAEGVVSIFDPVGDTSAMLKALGYDLQPWTEGNATGEMVVIGRKALSDGHRLPGAIQSYLANGGRVVVMGQDPQWMRHALSLRTSPHLSRRVWRISGGHPVVVGLDDNDLRDWNGWSRVVEPYPHWPGYQWRRAGDQHWGNRGAVSSGSIEKPHRSGLRPLLEAEFDLAYSPLMEMEYGRGRLILCTLDLEDHIASTPPARKLARQVLEYARTASITARVERVVYLGGAEDARTLDLLGVKYEQVDALDRPADVLILGRGAAVEDAMIAALAGQGARVLVMRRDQPGQGPLGAEYEQVNGFAGSLDVPDWFEARGLSASDLRWRAEGTAIVLKDGNEKIQWGAGGQIGKMPVGRGLVIFAQVHPAAVPADEKTYFRLTRQRQTRALAQLLSNLGASFKADDRLVQLIEKPQPAWMLAGPWQAQLTHPEPASPPDRPHPNPAISDRAKRLVAADAPESGWQTVSVPAFMENYGGEWINTDGEAVFRRTITVPAHVAGKDLFISLGEVEDEISLYFNGELLTSRAEAPTGGVVGWRIPAKLIKTGENVIAVRLWDGGGAGGLSGSPDHLFVRLAEPVQAFYYPSHTDTDGAQTRPGVGDPAGQGK